MRSVVIHGHFYQPPREDPWTGTIPVEPSAAPFHDWNERIERECYAPVAPSLARLSFDFGPTLLAWLERHAPATYTAVLAADRASVAAYGGHGSAIAMPFHHTILPLSSRRDKVTEVRWGIADFRRRFAREPEGMWLPETAVDDETLDVVAAAGIRFTILAPHQVTRVPAGGFPGWYRTAGGGRIAVFLYDGAISHDVAFGPLVRDAAAWTDRLTAAPADLVAVATDGETYGHHHRGRELRGLPRPAPTPGRGPPRRAELLELPARGGALEGRVRLPRGAGARHAPALARAAACRARLAGRRVACGVRARSEARVRRSLGRSGCVRPERANPSAPRARAPRAADVYLVRLVLRRHRWDRVGDRAALGRPGDRARGPRRGRAPRGRPTRATRVGAE